MYNIMHRIAIGGYPDVAGFGLIDSHGDLAEDVLASIPRERLQSTIWFDPTDTARPFGINLVPYAPDNPLEAEHTTEAFASIWKLERDTERLLKHVFILHSFLPDSTLFECLKMFHNDHYLREAAKRCGNPVTRRYWLEEYPLWALTPRFRADRVDPVVAMFETLLQHPALQRIFGQPESTIDFRQVMDAGELMVCSLARGVLGDQASRLLGAVLVAKFRSAAYSRVDLAPEKRRLFPLFMDEFHEQTEGEVGGRVVRNLASGSRKFGLIVCLAHQGSYQDPLTTQAAMSNCYTKVAFAVNTDELEREFRIMEWKEVDFDAQSVWVKEGSRDVFYAEPVGMLQPSLDERLLHYARREQIVDWSQERFGPGR